ncbi:MAG: ribonuclease H [bacterium]|nr:ribonuclease H [bacterium]
MSKIALFTDVSIDPKSKIGFGAYLVIPESDLSENSFDTIKDEVKVRKFESTSSTKLEIETVLWALEELEKSYKIKDIECNLLIYTDSQCIDGLLNRRNRLEYFGFKSSRTKNELHHAILYRKFYDLSDRIKFEIVKLKGHSKVVSKDLLHKIFSNVDKGARKALREYLENTIK